MCASNLFVFVDIAISVIVVDSVVCMRSMYEAGARGSGRLGIARLTQLGRGGGGGGGFSVLFLSRAQVKI